MSIYVFMGQKYSMVQLFCLLYANIMLYGEVDALGYTYYAYRVMQGLQA